MREVALPSRTPGVTGRKEMNEMDKEWNVICWMLRQIADDHGCLTGDCPHATKVECVNALLADYNAMAHPDEDNDGGQAHGNR